MIDGMAIAMPNGPCFFLFIFLSRKTRRIDKIYTKLLACRFRFFICPLLFWFVRLHNVVSYLFPSTNLRSTPTTMPRHNYFGLVIDAHSHLKTTKKKHYKCARTHVEIGSMTTVAEINAMWLPMCVCVCCWCSILSLEWIAHLPFSNILL